MCGAKAPPPGLCGRCRWRQIVRSARGSIFVRCRRSEIDARFARYPVLPVIRCDGFEAEPHDEESIMGEAIHIRPATAADVPTILSFIRQLAEYERLLEHVTATEERLRATLFGADPAGEVLLAESEGTPVGFALFFRNYSTFLAQPGIYLEDLFVLPEARGRGAGRRLLQALAALAVERGCGRLEWAVLDWNRPAIGFYQRMGAEALDGWTVYRLTGEPLDRLGKKG